MNASINKPRNAGSDRLLQLQLDAVILAVTDETPRVLALGNADDGTRALPSGPLDPNLDITLEKALRGWVNEQTGLEIGYVEQLYTFADPYRDPQEHAGGPRLVSVGYLALVREHGPAGTAQWRAAYDYFPWEDWRGGTPAIVAEVILPGLEAWIETLPKVRRSEQRERTDIVFGLHGAPWDPERVLERYELLYEAGLVEESNPDDGYCLGLPMALDHRRIFATALGRIRGKLKYRPVVFELLPPTFTLLQLQRVVEALSGVHLHKQNFRRLVEQGGLVEETGQRSEGTGGRPAKLFTFRREVLRERPAPGVGLPRKRN